MTGHRRLAAAAVLLALTLTGCTSGERDETAAASCTYHQLDVPVRYDLAEVLGG